MKGTKPLIMEGTRPNAYSYGGHPAPTGPALTNDLCGQNVKVNIKTETALANAEINTLTLILTLNILTAFIRLGRAGPVGAGCPP